MVTRKFNYFEDIALISTPYGYIPLIKFSYVKDKYLNECEDFGWITLDDIWDKTGYGICKRGTFFSSFDIHLLAKGIEDDWKSVAGEIIVKFADDGRVVQAPVSLGLKKMFLQAFDNIVPVEEYFKKNKFEIWDYWNDGHGDNKDVYHIFEMADFVSEYDLDLKDYILRHGDCLKARPRKKVRSEATVKELC